MKTLKRILGVLLIFLCGVFIGAAIANAGAMQKLRKMLIRGPEAVMDGIVSRLDAELKLDSEQRRRMQAIVDEARIELRQSRAKIQPEVEATLQKAGEKARVILYPDQVKKFDRIMDLGRQRWKAQEAETAAAPIPPATPDPAAPAR